ncbi:MAG: MarC family protein [Bdellovibrionota bacterium]|nr:MarC family protein [Deltaproteobacteria bacterium]
MNDFFSSFLTAFIPIFVAIDAVGLAPVYISMTDELDEKVKNAILIKAMVTASIIGLGFLFLGKEVFAFLGIQLADFKIAGGLILLILSIHDLVFSISKRKEKYTDSIGVVPLGMPLVMGPGTMSTMFVLIDKVGIPVTFLSLAINLVITAIFFHYSKHMIRIIGKGGAEGVSKIANLMLASIAVMIIRTGIIEAIARAKM